MCSSHMCSSLLPWLAFQEGARLTPSWNVLFLWVRKPACIGICIQHLLVSCLPHHSWNTYAHESPKVYLEFLLGSIYWGPFICSFPSLHPIKSLWWPFDSEGLWVGIRQDDILRNTPGRDRTSSQSSGTCLLSQQLGNKGKIRVQYWLHIHKELAASLSYTKLWLKKRGREEERARERKEKRE